jgi:phosphatidylserine decarboxylase
MLLDKIEFEMIDSLYRNQVSGDRPQLQFSPALVVFLCQKTFMSPFDYHFFHDIRFAVPLIVVVKSDRSGA